MRHTSDDETTIVADARDALTATEDDGEICRAITDLDFDGRNPGARLDAHASNLATHGDAFTHRHVCKRHQVKIAELRTESLGDEFFLRLRTTGEEILESHCGFQRTLNDVSTRKLIIASLVCGLLILVAGTVKLLQTASDTTTPTSLLKVGASTTVSGLNVTVNEVVVTTERTFVTVTMNGLANQSPLVGWSMLANGEITEPVGSRDCPATANEVTCTLEFVVAVGTPTIVFARDGEKSQWLGS